MASNDMSSLILRMMNGKSCVMLSGMRCRMNEEGCRTERVARYEIIYSTSKVLRDVKTDDIHTLSLKCSLWMF